MPNPVITWTRPMLERFKTAYANTTADLFIFDGNTFVKEYAKYLIEYLEEKI